MSESEPQNQNGVIGKLRNMAQSLAGQVEKHPYTFSAVEGSFAGILLYHGQKRVFGQNHNGQGTSLIQKVFGAVEMAAAGLLAFDALNLIKFGLDNQGPQPGK